MPPVIPLLASVAGAELLPALFGSTILGLGTGTVGGALGGALGGAGLAMAQDTDPLTGALLGGVTGGLGGPTIAGGLDQALAAPGMEIASGLSSSGSSAAVGAGAAAAPAASAASLAAPASVPIDAALAGAPEAFGTSSLDTAFGAAGGGGLGTTGGTGAIAAPVEEPGFFDSIGDTFDSIFGGGSTGTASPASPGGGGGGSTGGGTMAAPAVATGAVPGAPAGAAPAAGGAAPPAAGGFDWKSLALPAIGLGVSGFQTPQSFPGEDALLANANSMNAQANQLRSGALPPGIDAGLRSAGERAKAAMRSMFASKGMSGSSSEIAAVANIDQTVAQQGAELAMKMIDSGIQEAGLSNQLYLAIMRNAMARDQSLGDAIGRFASSLAGGGQLRAA